MDFVKFTNNGSPLYLKRDLISAIMVDTMFSNRGKSIITVDGEAYKVDQDITEVIKIVMEIYTQRSERG